MIHLFLLTLRKHGYRIFIAMGLLACWLPGSTGRAERPSVESVVEAFRRRAAETRYLRYRGEGAAIIPANCYDDSDPMSDQSSGKTYPKVDTKFDWIAAVEMNTDTNQAVYEDRFLIFDPSDKSFSLKHERTYYDPPFSDVEYLLPAEPENPNRPPRPDVRFRLNIQPNFMVAGAFGVPQIVLAAFGHITRDHLGNQFPIADPDWPIEVNSKITATDSEQVVTWTFTDETVLGNIGVYRLDCEAAPPHRLLRLERQFGGKSLGHSEITYRNDTTDIATIRTDAIKLATNKTALRGRVTMREFETSDSGKTFAARAKPNDGVWVKDDATERTYQFKRDPTWGTQNTILLILATFGALIAVYMFKRTFGPARS